MITGPALSPYSGGPPRQLIVLLHGYGADGADLIGLGSEWGPLFADALIAAPNAPGRCAQNPFGYEWFPLAFDAMLDSVRVGVPGARAVVVEYLDDLWTKTGLGPAQTVLAGFSQGAMLALNAGLSLATPPAGIVSFSGALVPPDGFGRLELAKAPVCLVHGDRDTVVDPVLTREAATRLAGAGYDVRVHLSRGAAHGIAPDGLAFATAFIATCFAAANA